MIDRRTQEVVGWPPVRSLRKRALEGCKYVKVAVDGAPYLRKVDLEIYNSYQELLRALEQMFMTCFAIHGEHTHKHAHTHIKYACMWVVLC